MIEYFNVYFEDECWLCISRKKAKEIVGNLVVNNAIDDFDLDIKTKKKGVATEFFVSTRAKQ